MPPSFWLLIPLLLCQRRGIKKHRDDRGYYGGSTSTAHSSLSSLAVFREEIATVAPVVIRTPPCCA